MKESFPDRASRLLREISSTTDPFEKYRLVQEFLTKNFIEASRQRVITYEEIMQRRFHNCEAEYQEKDEIYLRYDLADLLRKDPELFELIKRENSPLPSHLTTIARIWVFKG